MTRCLYIVILLAIPVLYSSCSSSGAAKNSVTLMQSAMVTPVGGEKKIMKKGTALPLDNAYLIEAPGHISLMVVPDEAGTRTLKADLRRIETWGGMEFNRRVNDALNKVVGRVNSVQFLLATQKPKEAMEELNKIERTNPQLTALNFLKASCFVMLKDNERAKFVLEQALREFPSDESGLELYKELTGKAYEGGKPAPAGSGGSSPAPKKGASK